MRTAPDPPEIFFYEADSFARPIAFPSRELSNGDFDLRRGNGVRLKKQRYSRNGIWAAALAMAILLVGLAWKSSFSATHGSVAAPDFVFTDSGGTEVRLSDYRGKVVALNFWATWCGPCRLEVPWLNRLEMQNAGKGFAVLGISVDEQGWAAVKPFLAELKVTYRVLLGDRRSNERYTGSDVLPTTVLIDRGGRVAGSYLGVVKRARFEKRLQELLQESKD